MRVRIPPETLQTGGPIFVERNGKPYYRDSQVWYHLKKELNKMLELSGRQALIKVLMVKHGHLTDGGRYYIINGDHYREWRMAILDNKYQIRSLYKAYNAGREVELWMMVF